MVLACIRTWIRDALCFGVGLLALLGCTKCARLHNNACVDFELLFEALHLPPFSPVLKPPRPRTLGMFMFTGTLDGSHAWVDGCANGGRLQDRPVQTFTRVLRQCQRDDRSLAVVGQRPFLHLNERQPSIYQAGIPDQRETSLYLHLFSITFYQSSFPCLSAALTVYFLFLLVTWLCRWK